MPSARHHSGSSNRRTPGRWRRGRGLAGLLLAGSVSVAIVGVGLTAINPASAAEPRTANGVTVSSTAPESVTTGTSAKVLARATSTTNQVVVIDLEIYDAKGTQVHQEVWERTLKADSRKSVSTRWQPSTPGEYRVAVGVFTPGWAKLLNWHNNAASISVTGPGATPPPTTTTMSSSTASSATSTSTTTRTTSTTTLPITTVTTTRPTTTSTTAPTTTRPTTTSTTTTRAATTTTSTTTRPPTTTPAPAPGGTPVQRWGQLRVCGAKICAQNGSAVQLRGVSSMWLNWENNGYAENREALVWMRDTWGLSVIRAAMGVEPDGAYLDDPTKARAQVERIINNAVAAGVYVIIDWHGHEAHNDRAAAQAFFGDLAKRYGHLPNVLWETYNEPLQVSWSTVLKPYHEAVVGSIRANDPDNIVILGTPTWSQAVDQAAANPVAGSNLMYTLHFYSCTHTSGLRAKAEAARRAGLPLFVTEWGATHADGGRDGRVCQPEGQAWVDWMAANDISWAAWKLDDCAGDSSCLLNPGAPVNGRWDNWLHGHAAFVRDSIKG